MPNPFFQFKQFTVHHDRCAMKVTTDACLFGAWAAKEIHELTDLEIQLLDIGTGTGLLSLMVAQKNNIHIHAIEINKEAADQAKENITASPWKNRIEVIQEDVLQWSTGKKYDCIISNPPFYETELKSPKHTKNIAHHDGGLKLAELFNFIKNHLANDGFFYLLLPFKRKEELNDLLKLYHFYLHKQIEVKQTLNHQPFRIMIKAGNKRQDLIANDIAVRNSSNEYTSEFIRLLKDYYLYL
jgi:tRNA1Val (adenine37-N6)-methyltransferase